MSKNIPVITIELTDPDNGEHGYFYGVKLTRYRDGKICNIVHRDYYHTTDTDSAVTDILDFSDFGNTGAL